MYNSFPESDKIYHDPETRKNSISFRSNLHRLSESLIKIGEIEKAIMIANIGFNPMNNGESVIINVPPLTEERRRELAKQAKAEAEDAKIVIRNQRKDANNDIKKLDDVSDDVKKNAETDIQTLTDSYVKKIDEKFVVKEKEIMTV